MLKLNTYSIVAYDAAEQAWGAAVASKFLAAGGLVCWARAGAGAVATQAFAKVGFGPEGLAMMGDGMSAEDTLDHLLSDDPSREDRQVGVVDSQGRAAAFTGADCFEWAGHRVGRGYACQGNILTGPETLDAMATTFENAGGELADRLVAALLAGEEAGGDSRGKQCAAVQVVRHNGGYGGDTDRYLDLRVDDDPEPVRKLARMVELHHLYFGSTDPTSLLSLDPFMVHELQRILKKHNFYNGEIDGKWGEKSREAFWVLCGIENLEERAQITFEGDHIDPVVLKYIREHFGA